MARMKACKVPFRAPAATAGPRKSGMNRLLLFALLALTAGIDGVHAEGAATGAVVGTVSYRQRVALPADAVVEVRLQDTSRADVAARTVGQTTIATAGAQVPIPYRIEYNPATIDPTHSYSVRATITVGGRLLFSSTTMYPVLTRGAGNEAAIDVYMILPDPAASAPIRPPVALENTFWKLVSLGDTPSMALPAGREASFRLHPEDRRLSGSGGCNRLAGNYELSAGALKVVPGGTTMMMCPEGLMHQEGDFVSALQMTTSYAIAGDTLELRNGERVLARFMAQNPK